MPTDLNITLESLREWRDQSVLITKSFGPSNGKSSTVDSNSLGNPERWSQDTLLMTTAVARDLAAVSVESRAAYNAVLVIRCPSEIKNLNYFGFFLRNNFDKFQKFGVVIVIILGK